MHTNWHGRRDNRKSGNLTFRPGGSLASHLTSGNSGRCTCALGSLPDKRDSYPPALSAPHGSWGPIKVAARKCCAKIPVITRDPFPTQGGGVLAQHPFQRTGIGLTQAAQLIAGCYTMTNDWCPKAARDEQFQLIPVGRDGL